MPESKEIFTSGITARMARGEEIVFLFYHYLYGDYPSNATSFLKNLLLPLEDTCRKPLPHCKPDFSLPRWSRHSSINSMKCALFLRKSGNRLLEIKSIALCPDQLNRRLASLNKLQIDYLLFETLMFYFRKKMKKEILFLCGNIGSTASYEKFFNNLINFPYGVRKRSEEVCYLFPEWGEVRFEVNGDKKYTPIAFSSLFGKYIRELFVEQMNSFFLSHLPNLSFCSGYRDFKTKQFIRETASLRKKLKIPDNCFVREKQT